MNEHHKHTQGHPPHALRVHKALKDPTRTTALRSRFEQEMNRRFAKLRRLIAGSIIHHDILDLRTNAVPSQKFDFSSDPKKVNEFMKWVRSESNLVILGTKNGTAVKSANDAWANVYLESAYQKGLSQAASELRSQGVKVSPTWVDGAFFQPVHADAAGIIFTRAFDELKDVTSEMADQMGAVLAQGIAEGQGPDAIARMLTDRVDKVGRTRARLIARTETISAHAKATLNAYKEAGAEGVTVQAEFTTAGDDDVCPECDALEGTIYSIDDADGLIPVHPNCRCAFLPVVDNPEDLSLGDGPQDDVGDDPEDELIDEEE